MYTHLHNQPRQRESNAEASESAALPMSYSQVLECGTSQSTDKK